MAVGTAAFASLPLDTWSHLVITVDRSNFKQRYYINGVLDREVDLCSAFTGDLNIAGRDIELGPAIGPDAFEGKIDELKVFRSIQP